MKNYQNQNFKALNEGVYYNMFFSRWTLFQSVIVLLLGVIAYIADMFNQDIAITVSSSAGINRPMLLTFLFVFVVTGLLSLLMYFQTKKSETFLKHSLWDKMYILTPILFILSMVVLFSFALIDSLIAIVENNRWIIYLLIYYALFLINVIVLAFIHKVKKNAISNETKVEYSFIWTSLVLFVILFIL
jgi:hypothetical protein